MFLCKHKRYKVYEPYYNTGGDFFVVGKQLRNCQPFNFAITWDTDQAIDIKLEWSRWTNLLSKKLARIKKLAFRRSLDRFLLSFFRRHTFVIDQTYPTSVLVNLNITFPTEVNSDVEIFPISGSSCMLVHFSFSSLPHL